MIGTCSEFHPPYNHQHGPADGPVCWLVPVGSIKVGANLRFCVSCSAPGKGTFSACWWASCMQPGPPYDMVMGRTSPWSSEVRSCWVGQAELAPL